MKNLINRDSGSQSRNYFHALVISEAYSCENMVWEGGEECAAWWPEADSNRRHRDFQSLALPAELSGRTRY